MKMESKVSSVQSTARTSQVPIFLLDFLLTVTTIIKTVIGSGILGLPFTVSKCGYVFAIIVFVASTAAIQFCSMLLLRAKNLSGHSNFTTILYHMYQNKVSKSLGSILIFFNNIGICIIEIIIFKVTIRKILVDVLGDNSVLDDFYTSKTAIALFIALCEVPSILVKKIERLKFMALLGVAGILVFVFTFVAHYFIAYSDYTPLPEAKEMALFPEDWFEAIASIPNLILALAFQMNFFPVFKGMRNASDRKMTLATLVGVLVCSASYLIVGVLGYHLVHTINDGVVEANFLKSLPYDSV
jgi:amino acid permease